MQNINSVLNSNIKRHHFEDKILAQKVFSLWERVLCDFLPDAASKTMARSLENGVLYVASLCHETAAKIKQLQKRILYELNSRLGKSLVFSIYIEV